MRNSRFTEAQIIAMIKEQNRPAGPCDGAPAA